MGILSIRDGQGKMDRVLSILELLGKMPIVMVVYCSKIPTKKSLQTQ